MSIVEKKKMIRQYLDGADDRFLDMVFALMQEYSKDRGRLTIEEYNQELDAVQEG